MIELAKPVIGTAERERIAAVLDSGTLADGPPVRSFEDAFASYCGADHAVATSNGTTALHTALEALGIGAGDRVLTTPFSFIASANAIRLAGAEPVFVDIDQGTYTLDPTAVEQTLTRQADDIEAILAVHLYGLPAAMGRLADIADAYDLALVEDAAQAHGATVDGTPVGSIGDVGCFSFYPTKNMTTGEGGMVVTDDPDIAERAARFVNHGRADGGYPEVGHNFRMTSIAAALGEAQLACLPEYVTSRRTNAAELTAGLSDAAVTTPTEPSDRKHAYNQYTVRCGDRAGLTTHLDAHDIGYGIYYPNCITDRAAYSDASAAETPNAHQAASEVISLPVHPHLDAADIDRITEAVSDYV